jgi:hypothetical protein
VEAPRIEVVNLTRGVFCPHLDRKHPAYPIGNYRYSRIQSTQCEMKQWDAVVLSLGADLWMHLALGHRLVVHDYSEKPYKHDDGMKRETRACWQGLQFIRYVAERMWMMPLTSAYGRNRQQLMNPQFSYFFDDLKGTTKNYVRYWRNHRDQLGNRAPVQLVSCWREDGQLAEQPDA